VTDVLTGPLPVVAWDATEDEWLFARTKGIGGSDIAAVLGFSGYHTPWEVWAEKSDVKHWNEGDIPAAELGSDLEPWLVSMAPKVVGVAAIRTEHRTYARPEHPWRRYSPDGLLVDGRLFEAKTAGLMGWRAPSGWDDGGVPLGYEFQVRWGMHVMDTPAAEVVGLVAGMGLVHRTITRDLAIERELVEQISEWWHTYVVNGVEPPMGAGDAANLTRRYPKSDGGETELDPIKAIDAWTAYRDARDRESAAKAEKDAAGAVLKSLLGKNEKGLVDGHVIVTWGAKKGQVDWQRLVTEWAAELGVTAPDPDAFRKPSSRSLNGKD